MSQPPRADQEVTGRIQDVRVLLDGGFSIRVLEGSPIAGRILLLSENEIKLGLSEALLPGLFVQVRMGTRIIMGKVVTCVPSGDGFHVFVEIESIFLMPLRGSTDEGPGSADV